MKYSKIFMNEGKADQFIEKFLFSVKSHDLVDSSCNSDYSSCLYITPVGFIRISREEKWPEDGHCWEVTIET